VRAPSASERLGADQLDDPIETLVYGKMPRRTDHDPAVPTERGFPRMSDTPARYRSQIGFI
jgi:hypothetical protein